MGTEIKLHEVAPRGRRCLLQEGPGVGLKSRQITIIISPGNTVEIEPITL